MTPEEEKAIRDVHQLLGKMLGQPEVRNNPDWKTILEMKYLAVKTMKITQKLLAEEARRHGG